ncbi:MAG: ABC transporter permease [Ruminococcus flavefaciens]|nr:ABC transporter permease [Ruminococcus flavefaciens]MCM1361655.1 ABC transporter permease [Clostridiales bacterium]MCM1436192.1 ABC transporter permease [Ruminococcus flavefaciens]
MKSMMKKAAFREIKGSFGRYFAILAIIALGVGFFSGVRITTPAMVNTINSFLDENQFYDYRILSSSGWSESDAESFEAEDDVRSAEAAYSLDAVYNYKTGKENVLKTHSITYDVNQLHLVSGRMPQSPDECVIDAELRKVPELNTFLSLSDENDENTLGSLNYSKFKIVGTVYSPLYVNFERGTTSIGNGSVSGFVYMLPEAFNMSRYSEIYVRFDQDHEIYSDEYQKYMNGKDEKWEQIASEKAEKSYSELMNSMRLPVDDLPASYVLDRNTNIGYACFESDSEIVAQVAKVFPIFFILVAALVCMTTMSRMVEEQRTQIGVFKALGYSGASIMNRYLFYSGSAALIGCILGYTIGSILFPAVIWMTYKLMYIHLPMKFVFDYGLFAMSVLVSLICTMGVTWISCRNELSETSASLMRPKSPKAGKRVLIERIPFVWNRIKFLHKVSIRNIFRYKKRFFMMILGISGCTALLLTGFGIKDSIAGFADMQYGEIITADAAAAFSCPDGNVPEEVISVLDEKADNYIFLRESNWDLLYGDRVKSITLLVPENYDDISSFMNFRTSDGKQVESPALNEVIISNSIQERYGADIGDEIVLRNENMDTLRVKVSGVFENHVYNYIFISAETMESQLSEALVFNEAYINFSDNDDMHQLSADIGRNKSFTSIYLFEDIKVRMGNMMNSLNYIVLLIIICAAVLAFIVIYNLTNINITERIREIATIKVLGFFRSETSAYVLRENLVLTAVGTLFGLGLGILLHKFIMAQIVVDLVSFTTRILPMSYVYSVALTFVFNFAVNIFMEIKLDRINMAESLKSVE